MPTMLQVSSSRRKKARRIHDLDHFIALRLRMARNEEGLSQSEVGEAIGVTFQQIQKYEQAKNRVSASTLFRLADVLKRDISYFFAAEKEEAWRAEVEALQNALPIDVGIAQALMKIDHPQAKKSLLSLIESLASK